MYLPTTNYIKSILLLVWRLLFIRNNFKNLKGKKERERKVNILNIYSRLNENLLWTKKIILNHRITNYLLNFRKIIYKRKPNLLILFPCFGLKRYYFLVFNQITHPKILSVIEIMLPGRSSLKPKAT